jgi:hypothetical protein
VGQYSIGADRAPLNDGIRSPNFDKLNQYTCANSAHSHALLAQQNFSQVLKQKRKFSSTLHLQMFLGVVLSDKGGPRKQ